MNHTHLISYAGYGGGGGGGGVYKHEATTVNYDVSMTINVDGGNLGEADSNSDYYGFAGSAGKVFLVSRFYVPIPNNIVCLSIIISLTYIMPCLSSSLLLVLIASTLD